MCAPRLRNQAQSMQEGSVLDETQVQREEFQSSHPWNELSLACVSPQAELVHSLQRTICQPVRKMQKPASLHS